MRCARVLRVACPRAVQKAPDVDALRFTPPSNGHSLEHELYDFTCPVLLDRQETFGVPLSGTP